jgi:predicted ester cyclase
MNIPYKKKNYSNSQYFYKLFIYDYVCNRYKFKLDDEIKYDKYKINLNEYLYKQFITISKNRFKIKSCVSILKKILTYNYFDRIKGEDIIYDKLFLELKLKGIVK